MAQSLRRPLFSLLTPKSSTPTRCFSQYRPLYARDGAQIAAGNSRPATAPERSLRVLAKSQAGQQIPSDLGLLDSTFVPPTGKNAISPIFSPNDFLHYTWHRFKYKFRDLISLGVLKFASPSVKRWYNFKVKLRSAAIKPTALALHQQMYTAFAEGDLPTLRKICTDGIFESFRTRLSNRPRGEKVQWELVEYNKRAKVVSNRAARLPMDGAAIRQAVVKISSKQRLTRWRKGRDGLVKVEGTGEVRDVVEYVVVQRMYINWTEAEWQVWGTTGETGLDDVDEWNKKLME